MRMALFVSTALFLMSACASTVPETQTPVQDAAPLMSWSDLTERPLPEPTTSVSYGSDPAQVVDIWLPDGPGPHPVVFMVHGGCWQKAIADRTLMNYAAEDLRQRGLAVWNIEYRGVDEAGGGYPGTYQDVKMAADSLAVLGADYNLDLNRVAAFGHSAGGHLASWLATQNNISDESVLAEDQTLDLLAVINSGSLADLETSSPVTLETCLANIQADLTGLATDVRPDVFMDTSPARLLPTKSAIISVNGDQDRIAPPLLGQDFTRLIQDSGSNGAYVEIANTGHVELIAPGTAAFDRQAALLLEYLGD